MQAKRKFCRVGGWQSLLSFLSAATFAMSAMAAGGAASAPGAQAGTEPATGATTTTTQTGGGFDDTLTGGWGGVRQKLADAGVAVGGTLVLEGFDNFMGGTDTAHLVGATTLDVNLTFDLEKLLKLQGGEVYFDLEDHAFRNPTTALTGDLQVFDRFSASPYLQVFELWYQQKLFDDKLRLKVGKVDANTEFCLIDNGLSFANSSTQLSPTIFLMPTTPDPMPSINVFFTPVDWYFAGIGVYDSNRSDRFGDLVDDPASVQRSRHGEFIIGETGFQWQGTPVVNFAGNLKFGGWGHTGTFERFDGTTQDGTGGGYVVFNQTLFQPAGEAPDGRGTRMFLEYGITQSDINPIDQHVGGGMTVTGPIESRAKDVVGLTAQYAHITHETGLRYPYELAIEGFYQVQLAPWTQLQPDLQYIMHPGGRYRDALVASLRWTIQF